MKTRKKVKQITNSNFRNGRENKEIVARLKQEKIDYFYVKFLIK